MTQRSFTLRESRRISENLLESRDQTTLRRGHARVLLVTLFALLLLLLVLSCCCCCCCWSSMFALAAAGAREAVVLLAVGRQLGLDDGRVVRRSSAPSRSWRRPSCRGCGCARRGRSCRRARSTPTASDAGLPCSPRSSVTCAVAMSYSKCSVLLRGAAPAGPPRPPRPPCPPCCCAWSDPGPGSRCPTDRDPSRRRPWPPASS